MISAFDGDDHRLYNKYDLQVTLFNFKYY